MDQQWQSLSQLAADSVARVTQISEGEPG